MHPNDKYKPEKIGDDEPLTEGNGFIQRAGHNVIAAPDPHALENKKDNAEAGPEKQELQMGISWFIEGMEIQPPIVHDACMLDRKSVV